VYRTIIIDDEQTIRLGLKKIIDWEKHGFQIVDEAENGLVGYEKILSIHPDLILLDIKMPGLDGINLLRKIRQEGIESKVIFLTGFGEFEYAKEAIKLNAEAFLTKPFNEEELEEVLNRVAKDLDHQTKIDNQLESQKRLEEKQKYRRLLLGEKRVEKSVDLISLFCVASIQSDEKPYNINTFFDEFQRLHPSLLCLLLADSWVVVFKNMTLTRVKVAVYDLNNQLKKKLNERYLISIGRVVTGQHELYKSFEDAKMIGQKWYLTESHTVEFYSDSPILDTSELNIDSDLLYSYIEIGNTEGIESFYDRIKKSYESNSVDFKRIKGLCITSLLLVIEKVKFHYKEKGLVFKDYNEISKHLYEQEDLPNLLEAIKKYTTQIIESIHTGTKDNTLYKVLDYIDIHYDKPLKLERLGEIFGYNSSYLGTIFKEFTGMSFKSYLDSIRIEMAKKYLKEGHFKVYEVAELVGYSNVDYFHSKFKKYENMSPKKYQKTCREV